MNYRLLGKILGNILLVEGAAMLIPVIVALIYGESPLHFLLAIGIAVTIGFPLSRIKKREKTMRMRDGFITVGLAWVALSLFGALPFVFSGEIPSYVDAVFETSSGFTTTGASILTDVEMLSRGSLFWRSFTHWLGGMGVLVFALAILPHIGGSTQLMRAESSGPTPEKLVPRMGQSAKILYMIYFALTVVTIIALLLAGMPLFDSFCHGFGTAGTGGFSIYNNSYAHYNSVPIEVVTTVFMILFGINFTIFFRLLLRDFKGALRSQEMWLFLSIVVVAMLAVSLNIIPYYDGDVGMAFRQGTFHVSSIISTTGYGAANFDLWPQLSRVILLLVMMTGSCAGSTAGGLKSIRILILFKKIRCEIRRLLHPRSVSNITVDGRMVEHETVDGVVLYVAAYFMIIIVATVVVSFDNMSFDGTLSSVLATVNNIGPGLAEVGPSANFAGLSGVSKVTLTLGMLIGRLEIYPILLLFSPSAWKRA